MAIHRYANGIPRVINLLCEHCLVSAFVDQQKVDRPGSGGWTWPGILIWGQYCGRSDDRGPAECGSRKARFGRSLAIAGHPGRPVARRKATSPRKGNHESNSRSTEKSRAGAGRGRREGLQRDSARLRFRRSCQRWPRCRRWRALPERRCPRTRRCHRSAARSAWKRCWHAPSQLPWNPDPKTMLFFNGDDMARGTEQFRTLRSRLYHAREKMTLKKILVTSALPKEGNHSPRRIWPR